MTSARYVPELRDVTYVVTLTIPDTEDGDPDPSEIAAAIYRGVRDVSSEDAVHVEREG